MANTTTNAVLNAMLDALDATFNNGALEIRSGAAPGANQAPTGTVLASITLPADAFSAAAAGTKSKNGTWQTTNADATGTAAHYRIVTSGDGGGASETDPRIEGTVGVGSGDLQLDSVSITASQTVTITGYDLTQAIS